MFQPVRNKPEIGSIFAGGNCTGSNVELIIDLDQYFKKFILKIIPRYYKKIERLDISYNSEISKFLVNLEIFKFNYRLETSR